MSRSGSSQNFKHSSSVHTFSLPVPPPPPPPTSSTSVQHVSSSLSGLARCRPCSVCSSAARYSLVLDELQTCELSTTTQTGNCFRPGSLDATPSGREKTGLAAGTGRHSGGRVVPGRCRGRTSACSLVLLPMAALLSLEALWVANSWQVLQDMTEKDHVIQYQLMHLGRIVVDLNKERELTVLYAAARTVDAQIQLRSDLRRSSTATDRSLADLPVWPSSAADEGTPAMLRSRGLVGAVLERRRAVFVETGGGSGRFWDAMSFYTDLMDVAVEWLYRAVADLHRRLRQYDGAADLVTLLHAYGYLMAAANSVGAEQTLCRAFHSVVCFSRAETLAYANFSFAGETLYRFYRLSLPQSDVFDHEDGDGRPRYAQSFPALASCRREIFDDLDQYGMAIDPSLCDYGRKNETVIREVDQLTVVDASRLSRYINETIRRHQQACRRSLLVAVAAFGVTGIYAVIAHLVRCVWIVVERRRRTKSPAFSRHKQRRLDSDRELAVDTPNLNDDALHQEHSLQRHDGWARCNGDAPTSTSKTETNTLLPADERRLPSTRCAVVDETGDRQSKILSVTNCIQSAQITV